MRSVQITAHLPTKPEPLEWIVKHSEEYENAFFPIYQDYLKEKGLPVPTSSPVQMALSFILKAGGFAQGVSSQDSRQNPLLVTSKTFAQLSESRRREAKYYALSRRGLIYDNFDDAIEDTGIGVREEIPVRDYTVLPPALLLRGQRGRFLPASPLLRYLRNPPQLPEFRFPHSVIHTSLLFYLFYSILSDMEVDTRGNLVSYVVPSPFHLLLWQGGLDSASASEYSTYVTEVLRIQTLNALTERERRIYIAHLTDYELPAPILAILGFPQDYVPNPFVSTTTSISTALLYASGYFVQHSDKFNVDWSRVAELCFRQDSEEGFVYVISSKRWALPMTQLAGADTIGAKEDEFGLPASVNDNEIVNVIPVCNLVRRLGAVGFQELLRKQLDANSCEGRRILGTVGG
jgi:hypothetical protein